MLDFGVCIIENLFRSPKDRKAFSLCYYYRLDGTLKLAGFGEPGTSDYRIRDSIMTWKYERYTVRFIYIV